MRLPSPRKLSARNGLLSLPGSLQSSRSFNGTAPSSTARGLPSQRWLPSQRGQPSSRSTVQAQSFRATLYSSRLAPGVEGVREADVESPDSPSRRGQFVDSTRTRNADGTDKSPLTSPSPSPYQRGMNRWNADQTDPRPDLFGSTVFDDVELYTSPRSVSPRVGQTWETMKLAFVRRITSLYADVFQGL